ncbi:hypothetical protein [Nonomuraea lactucae]|uniref:hypothetical protein n=1 Tax=Nonomuraea lactucae TaxID=2249762 RepID=UPI001963969D|nr:hypothetical protein [Nonomuraea lactucae]
MPTTRTAVVAAKFAVAACWALLLALAGPAHRRRTRPARLVGHGRLLRSGPSAGRGYLAAVGVLFGLIFCAQVIAALGYGALFPWSVPGLYAGIAGAGQDPPGLVGVLLVTFTGVAGAVTTAQWWNRADHTR